MNNEVLRKYDVMSVAEGTGNTLEDAHNLVDANRHELNMAYPFEGVDVAKPEGYSLLHFKEVFSKWDSTFEQDGWLAVFLANHDQARMVSRFGNDSPAFRDLSSSMLTTFIMTMRGTPYYYNGDELGMTNAGFTKIEDYRDMPTLNEYRHLQSTGGDMQKFMQRIKFECRDNGRTPFQWDNSTNAGFTSGTPWIKVNPNYSAINEAAEENDENSCLNYFRKLAKLRKDNLTLVYGKYTLLDKDNPKVYAYTREGEGNKMLILLNFSASEAQANIAVNITNAKLLLSNYKTPPSNTKAKNSITLRPYEAIIYSL
jgi:oligo-1,6-glucosidase